MKVTSDNWQMNVSATYRSMNLKEKPEETAEESVFPDTDTFDRTAEALEGLNSKEQGSDYRMKSSTPSDSVGQLAAELSRSETRIDAQLVMSKAMKALTNLKMSSYACDDKDAKKIQQMIRRMKKLIKRISKKLKRLGQEEQLENQQKKAEKENQEAKVKEIREELRSRRNRRHRDERRYALQELNEDNKSQSSDMINSVMSSMSAASASPDLSALASVGGVDLSTAMGDMGSIDMMV